MPQYFFACFEANMHTVIDIQEQSFMSEIDLPHIEGLPYDVGVC